MPDVHTHCNGCGGEISEGEENIIIAVKGKSQLLENEMSLDVWDNVIWYGHENCYQKPLQNAHAFLQGNVYKQLNAELREQLFKGKLKIIFKKNDWPMGGE